ncbi:MAG: hypothetical protein WCF67_19540, partial [Chitinophagaceae bacterium]
ARLEPILLQEIGLAATRKKTLGLRKKVTVPNLASIMFLVEENNKTLLMTGDGHWEDILKGLKSIGRLDSNGCMHLDVLKVQHHGSEHNINEQFCSSITADHYILCGDGEHSNPDLDVVELILASRTSNLAKTAEAGNNFTMWFNSSSAVTKANNKAHMQKIEKIVKGKAVKFDNVRFKFMEEGKSFLNLSV